MSELECWVVGVIKKSFLKQLKRVEAEIVHGGERS